VRTIGLKRKVIGKVYKLSVNASLVNQLFSCKHFSAVSEEKPPDMRAL
jgi:hypothetical protein